jgi:cation diffusion facilitator family transporter
MIALLSRLFIKNHDEIQNPAVRRAYGMLCSILGIVLNVLLFAIKYFAGLLSGSIAVQADAFNNLSDAGSSFITMVGFHFSGKKPDKDHPFGHGRIEYISGLAVSVLILLMAYELAKSSVDKILHPAPVETNLLVGGILIVSIAAKLYMSFYNRGVGEKIDSSAMKATASDSFSDAIATAVVIGSMLITHFTGLMIDGWCGILVAFFILKAGYEAARDTLTPLLGTAPDPAFIADIESTVLAHSEIIGIHDLIVHDYGPGRVMISLHGEVPGSGDLYELHDTIDLIERELKEKLQCDAVIHMDPIATDDSAVMQMRSRVMKAISDLEPRLSIHDFRMVAGPTHTNLIFDVVVPADLDKTPNEVRAMVEGIVHGMDGNLYAVIQIDEKYT